MRVLLLACCLLFSGCGAGYYWQLARGQMHLMGERRPVEQVLRDSDTPPVVRRRLRLSREVLAFAGDHVGLPAADVYDTYVPLRRDWVVWNVFAAPPDSLQAKRWCYPFVGCASYRGYFHKQQAQRYMDKLREEGLDVYGAGAIAYSTLGWFSDPITRPMLGGDEADMADLLFHELTHRKLYVKGDTRFNESLATAVAAESVREWLAVTGRTGHMDDFRRGQQARARVMQWVGEARTELKKLYGSSASAAQKKAGKARIQQQLRDRFRQTMAREPALKPWEHWFSGPLNNAQLNTLNDYNGDVPAFNHLMLACGGRWSCFWKRARALADLPVAERHKQLEQWHD